MGRAAALVLRALAGEVAAASRQSTPGLASLRLSFWRRAAEAARRAEAVLEAARVAVAREAARVVAMDAEEKQRG